MANHIVATQAARTDINALTAETDPSGLQRAALKSVSDGPIEHTRRVAQNCRDAVALREYLVSLDAASERIFGG